MDRTTPITPGLTAAEIEQFITDGFVRIDDAFPRERADAARAILWQATGCNPDDPATWTQPVIRLGMFTQAPFIEAANTPRLHAAFDQLVGQGRWRRPAAMGTFPVRFPSADDPGDAGWHIDVSFGTETPDFMSWRANIHSKGRALLMLFLFSDVSASTMRRRASASGHTPTSRGSWRPPGDQGLTLGELAADGFAGERASPGRDRHRRRRHGLPVPSVPGARGAAAPGERPRFLAQPPLLPVDPDNRPIGKLSPVEQAVARALA